MAALWGFLGFFVFCATGSLSAALSLAQNQVAFQWPGQQSQPLSSLVKQPPSQANQPPSQANQPPSLVKQSPSPANQPPSQANQPPSWVKQPPSQANQPPSWVKQPPSQANQPPSQANQPPSWVKQPPSKAEPIQTCVVEDYEKVQCGEPGITPANCQAINCCFDGNQCYYGKTVTVQCTRDGQFVIVVARDSTLPSLSLDSISLLGGRDPPCGPVGTTASFAIYQFPVTACGTTTMMDGEYLVYENKMTSSYEVGIGPLGSITRDSSYTLLFQCRYSGTGVEALVVAVNTVPPPPPVSAPGPLSAQLRLANGQCSTKGCVQDDQAYSSFHLNDEYPVTKALREPVYAEVRVLGRTDPNIVLKLEHCWATSNPDPLSLPQWHLLVNGCPYQDDRYLTNMIPVDGSSGLQFPTHHKRFTLKMFTFVDSTSMAPLFQTVFVHCSTSVCTPTAADSCVQSCNRRRRDVGTSEDAPRAVVSSGEIHFKI